MSPTKQARDWLRGLGLGRDAHLDADEPIPLDRLEALEEVVCGMGGLADQDASTRFEMGQILKRIEALEGRHSDRRESPVEASPLVRDLRDELDRERLKATRWKERAKLAEAGLQALKGIQDDRRSSDSLVNAKHLGGFPADAGNRLAASGHWALFEADEGLVELVSYSLDGSERCDTIFIELEHWIEMAVPTHALLRAAASAGGKIEGTMRRTLHRHALEGRDAIGHFAGLTGSECEACGWEASGISNGVRLCDSCTSEAHGVEWKGSPTNNEAAGEDARRAFDAGFRMGYGNGHHDGSQGDLFDDAPDGCFEAWTGELDDVPFGSPEVTASGHWSLSDEGLVELSGSLNGTEHTVSIKLEHVMAAALLVADDEASEA